jgi:hypothetical protein
MEIIVILAVVTIIAVLLLTRNNPEPSLGESAPTDDAAKATSSRILPVSIEFAIHGEPTKVEWKFRTDGTGSSNYIANLTEVTCSCEEFNSRRLRFSQKDIRRFCGHLVKAHEKAGIWSDQQEIVDAMLYYGPIRGGCWAHDQILTTQLASGESVYFGTREGSKWVNVYTRKRRKGDSAGKYSGAYEKFGFDREFKKWSYGVGPPAAREIRQLIASFC